MAIAYRVATPIAINQIRPNRTTESESGSGPLLVHFMILISKLVNNEVLQSFTFSPLLLLALVPPTYRQTKSFELRLQAFFWLSLMLSGLNRFTPSVWDQQVASLPSGTIQTIHGNGG